MIKKQPNIFSGPSYHLHCQQLAHQLVWAEFHEYIVKACRKAQTSDSEAERLCCLCLPGTGQEGPAVRCLLRAGDNEQYEDKAAPFESTIILIPPPPPTKSVVMAPIGQSCQRFRGIPQQFWCLQYDCNTELWDRDQQIAAFEMTNSYSAGVSLQKAFPAVLLPAMLVILLASHFFFSIILL